MPPSASVPLEWQKAIDECCIHFEEAWKTGKGMPIEDCLRGSAGPYAAALFTELLRIEFEWRHSAGQRPQIQEYLNRFPEYAYIIRPEVADAHVARQSRQLDEIGSRFTSKLQAGASPKIEEHLERDPDVDPVLLFAELLAREVEHYLALQATIDVNNYQQRFPTYRNVIDIIVEKGGLPRIRARQFCEVYVRAAVLDAFHSVSYLEHCCGDDIALRRAVESVLGRRPNQSGPEQGPIATDAIDVVTGPSPAQYTSPLVDLDAPFSAERFEILSKIAVGGSGIVYEAHDKLRGSPVALKRLRSSDPRSIDRFKREFRMLADIKHPNLVSLYELFIVGPQCFFTMELVRGVPFRQYVRGTDGATLAGTHEHAIHRLRNSARQLAQGIAALHAAGLLHRDLKSSNVLVTDHDRTVVLDFGLAAFQDAKLQLQLTDLDVAGTLVYMSPEQAAAKPLGPATDWYSFGVMLFEAMTGRVPFSGGALNIIIEKQQFEPRSAREIAPWIPDDLEALCSGLLRRDPEERPSEYEILDRLGADTDPSVVNTNLSSGAQSRLLIGRKAEMEMLENTYRSVCNGMRANVLISGESGVGKSALVQKFLDPLVDADGVVVLRGRCYESESVPYKALDAVIDSLARYLSRLTSAEADALMPVYAGPLARVFPVLRRVGAIAAAQDQSPENPDQLELRRKAFGALRELLRRLGIRCVLVVAIDDLQWGDHESALLLAELLRVPDPPRMLLIGTHRNESVSCQFLDAFEDSGGLDADQSWQRVDLTALPPDETHELATALIGPDSRFGNAELPAIVHESGGNPYFVRELVRYVQAGSNLTSTSLTISLDNVLWDRISQLPIQARRLMEVVAVAGHPLLYRDAQHAAGVGSGDREAVAILRTTHLVRTSGTEAHDSIECYHDRIRESVVARLSPAESRHWHASLATALERNENADAEKLAVHFEGARDFVRACRSYAQAAERAANLLAFDRAAMLYERAVGLGKGLADVPLRLWRVAWADALANAGRGGEAASEYLAATEGATAAERLDLLRRSAMQWLISGHIDQGLESLRTVLRAARMPLPGTPYRALWRLLVCNAWLKFRGTAIQKRDESQVAAEDLSRIDTCWSAAIGLTMVDPIRASYYTAKGLSLALRAGEPSRVARAMAMNAIHSSIISIRASSRGQKMLARADELAQSTQSQHAKGLVALARGWIGCLTGDFINACQHSADAAMIFREKCTGVAWELDSSQIYYLVSTFFLGKLRVVHEQLSLFLKESAQRGDLYAAATIGNLRVLDFLAVNDIAAAQSELNDCIQRRPRQGFLVQHFTGHLTEVQFWLYASNTSAAWECACRLRKGVATSLMRRVQYVRILTNYYHGLAALACASNDGRLLHVAERDAHRLTSEDAAWAHAFAQQLRAGIAARHGEIAQSRTLFDDAATRFSACAMQLYASASRRRHAELLDGATSADLVREADRLMKEHATERPELYASVLAPRARFSQ